MRKKGIASIIFAAGYGSRMKGFYGNKTLLPLIPGTRSYEGDRPLIIEVIKNLPAGPKALVLNYRKDEVICATKGKDIFYYEQPVLNGTGGAIIAAQDFLRLVDQEYCIVTMGDVPLVKRDTYIELITSLTNMDMVVLGFKPKDKSQYGIVEINGEEVTGIIEWTYWKEYSLEKQNSFKVCNSGIYAVKRHTLIKYLDGLKKRPHTVKKERDGKIVTIEEYFFTDLIELMKNDGLSIGYTIAKDEKEVLGIDTIEDLHLAQSLFSNMNKEG